MPIARAAIGSAGGSPLKGLEVPLSEAPSHVSVGCSFTACRHD